MSKEDRQQRDEHDGSAQPLRLTPEQLEFITETAPVFIAELDRDLRYRFVNQTYARRFARDRGDIIGRLLWEVIGVAAYQRIKPYLDRVLAGAFVDFELDVPYSVVGTHRVHCAYAPERDVDGNTTGFVAVVTDITEHRRATELVRQNEERLRLGLDAGHVGTWDWEIERNHVTWSERLYEFHGLRPGSFTGGAENFLDLVHPLDRTRVTDAIQASLEHDAPYAMEFRAIRPDGTTRWLSTNGQVFRDEHGKPVRMLGATTDITERRQFEEELKRTKEAAEAANRAKDQFLAVLSHELRTPLTPILTAAQLLSTEPAMSEDHRDIVNMIARNVQLEARLIDDLLDLTRISRGKLELHFGVVNAHEKIKAVCEMCDAELRASQLQLNLDLTADQHILHADSTRLQQILWNLVKNAVKFTRAGGRVTIATCNNADGRLILSVNDTGVGIKPSILPRIFDAFEQGSRDMTRLFGGLGLGLTIAKALAEAHGGKLWAHSDGDGQGSTFTLELPTARLVSSALAAVQSPSPNAAPVGCRILLVEDHPDTARIMARLLDTYGYTVETADSVASALQAAGAQPFDIIISDLGLPDGSGHDLMRQLLSRLAIRGIALSGYGMEEDIARSHQAGFAEHLTKPVNMQKLRETIDRLTRAVITQKEDVAAK